jgi:dihydrolipoamide dehydrogenase
MTGELKAKVLVIGGGPGGYVAAIRAGQLGLDTVLVEGDRLGGTCLIRGCIPSKALIHVADKFDAMMRSAGQGRLGIRLSAPPILDLAQTMDWKNGIVQRLDGGVGTLLRKAKVKIVRGHAVFSDAKSCTVATTEGETRISAEHVILANGSLPVELPSLPFGGIVISSTEALSLESLPRCLVIVGGGYIGIELGCAFRKLGSEVTIVEAQDRILPPYDAALTEPVQRWLTRAGVKLHLGARTQALDESGDEAVIAVRLKDGATVSLPADRVLVTIGRRANLRGWGLEAMAVDTVDGVVRLDDQCRTSMRNVWAIGDLVGEPMLAHKASAQGEMVAEIIAGQKRRFEPTAIPAVCFTQPEIVTVGLLPGEAEARDIDVVIGTFPFAANGRAMTLDDDDGFVRVVARRDNHRILGIQAVGAHVSELSSAFVHAIEMASVVEDLVGTIQVHPTLGEALREAAMRAVGSSIHM